METRRKKYGYILSSDIVRYIFDKCEFVLPPLLSYIRFIVQINQIGHHAIGGKILPFVFS